MAVGNNTKNKHHMKNSVIMPVSRETAAEELGANLENAGEAEKSFRSMVEGSISHILIDLLGGKSEFEGADGVTILNCFGLLEAFAIHCVRLDINAGELAVLVPWFPEQVAIEPGIYHFRAGLNDAKQVENFSCYFDPGFPPGCFGRIAINRTIKEWRSMERDRLVGIQETLNSYVASWRTGWRADLVSPQTVVRHRLSPSQSFRKLLAERWCDPTIRPLDRFEPMSPELKDWKRFFAIAENLRRNVDTALRPEESGDY